MDPQLLTYYEAIERASADMLHAARAGHWDEVVKLEGACVLLISQLKHAAQASPVLQESPNPDAETGAETGAETLPAAFGLETVHAEALAADATRNAARSAKATLADRAATQAARVAATEAARTKAHIMQRILVNDAEIRQLAEPWLQNLDEALQGQRRTLH